MHNMVLHRKWRTASAAANQTQQTRRQQGSRMRLAPQGSRECKTGQEQRRTGTGMNTKARLASVTAAVAALVLPVALTSCSSNSGTDAKNGSADAAGPAPSVVVTPAANARMLPVTTEIAAKVSNGTVTTVTLTDANGKAITGSMRLDDSSWVPSEPLAYGQSYTARVTATNAGGTIEKTTSFSTMAKPSTPPIHTSFNVDSAQKYGVGMPIVVDFGSAIPDKYKDDVERRLFVTSYPAQVGAWRWYSDTEVAYRPKAHWRTGTTVDVRLAVGGQPIGNRVIEKDRDATFTIGRDMQYAVTNRNHTMTITSNGKVVKKYPISMGKPRTPSWSGKFVIMDRLPATVFDTIGEPDGGYRIAVKYAERLTWSGTFFHSAPWSVGQQGRVNVSHGCVNLAPAAAKWIYKNSLVGDPASISGTSRRVAQGNGWTVWDISWNEYIEGSALDSPVAPQPTLSRKPI
jgi:lipoprotein-anchoring transpeptidase ErfK/SrfK